MRVLDLFSGIVPTRDRSEDSASYRVKHGMLGIESRPFLAMCSLRIAMPHSVYAPDGGQYRVRETPRMIDTFLVHRDGVHKIASDFHQAPTFLSISHSTKPFFLFSCFQVCSKILSETVWHFLWSILANNVGDFVGLVLAENADRIAYKIYPHLAFCFSDDHTDSVRNSMNNIYASNQKPETVYRRERNV